MMTLKLNLPDELAQRAQSAGLLTDASIQKLLEEAIRREAGRKLLGIAQQLHDANIPPMSDEDIMAGARKRVAAAGIPPMSLDEIQSEVDAYHAYHGSQDTGGG